MVITGLQNEIGNFAPCLICKTMAASSFYTCLGGLVGLSTKTPSKVGGRARGELIRVDDEEQDHGYILYTRVQFPAPQNTK